MRMPNEQLEKLKQQKYVAEKKLTFIFQSEAVHKKLNLLIESRRETQEADEGENP